MAGHCNENEGNDSNENYDNGNDCNEGNKTRSQYKGNYLSFWGDTNLDQVILVLLGTLRYFWVL